MEEGVEDWFCNINVSLTMRFRRSAGLVIALAFDRVLRMVLTHHFIGLAPYLVFYLLLAIFVAGDSSLGMDGFSVASIAGASFRFDGWLRRELA